MPASVIESYSHPQDILGLGDLPIPDPYNIEGLEVKMGQLGFGLKYSPETPTTMAIIEEHALRGVTSPIVALTDHQTQGIGREGRVWNDVPGKSILMSILVQIDKSSITTYADLVALRTCQALRQATSQPIQIKWPNDIVYQDRKAGGILVRNIHDDQGRCVATNIGIGINVHQKDSQLPPSDYGATSLDMVTGSSLSRENLVLQIVRGIRDIGPDAEIIPTNPASRAVYNQLWKELSSLLGRRVEVQREGEPVVGKVINTQIGQGLVLETPTGLRTITLFDPGMRVRVI